jgi:glycine cleavage system H lipoate-binding protein
MKAIPVMTKSIDDDPENANWLHQMRNKKKTSKKKPLKVEEVKKLALELINKK